MSSCPTPADLAWKVATRRAAVVTAVEARLARAGAVVELRQLQGLSAQEMDVLIHREIHEPTPDVISCAPGSPQAVGAEVAA